MTDLSAIYEQAVRHTWAGDDPIIPSIEAGVAFWVALMDHFEWEDGRLHSGRTNRPSIEWVRSCTDHGTLEGVAWLALWDLVTPQGRPLPPYMVPPARSPRQVYTMLVTDNPLQQSGGPLHALGLLSVQQGSLTTGATWGGVARYEVTERGRAMLLEGPSGSQPARVGGVAIVVHECQVCTTALVANFAPSTGTHEVCQACAAKHDNILRHLCS